ncbi:MAG: 3-methyl-2-oxobutanoate hydroxymethyltransferase [Gammaproteobacteria bacterium]|nr:3-methyl-2-oxobutanoate hydroxymethyltransferase [Gammaproteobacteria bacterium]
MKRLTSNQLQDFKVRGEKIACVTCYDASFARVMDAAGMDVLLVGDSLGNVLHGAETTLGVTIDDMVYHARWVSRGSTRAHVMVDMPFLSYSSDADACRNAGRLLGEGGAQMVKIEGGGWVIDIVAGLTMRGVPVCAHLGLTPQFIHQIGGYRVQGREPVVAEAMVNDARALADAGATMLVLEQVPSALAKRITDSIEIPVIGIGAGVDCDGQVLVMHDLIGASDRVPKMARDFLADNSSIAAAVGAYVAAVKAGTFPGPENSFD